MALKLRIQKQGKHKELVFDQNVTIGRHPSNDIHFDDPRVSRFHAEVIFDGQWWWIRDLNSKNGTYLNGKKIEFERLPLRGIIELGLGGPTFETTIPKKINEEFEPDRIEDGLQSETQIIRHFFEGSDGKDAGDKTLMFRRAFKRAQKKKTQKYLIASVVSIFLLLTATGVIYYQKTKINRLRSVAVDIFYSMKVLELEIAHLQDLIAKRPSNAPEVRVLKNKKTKLKDLKKAYDNFVKDLGIYQGLPPKERLILRVARIFGECEVNVPKGFSKEVKNYIEKWRNSGRLKRGLNRAIRKGYDRLVSQIFSQHGITPYFLFLGLQESGFNEKAVGPKTKYGYAKGPWQFIPITAKQYGLRLGPLYKKRVYDPLDERFNFRKATIAAAKYIKDLYNTEAQASGLLVMAAYNWGHNRVRKIIRKMPKDPQHRNFWNLLKIAKIPKETYDYIFYIFSAAVICENPKLFNFDLQCGALPPLEAQQSTRAGT